MRRVGVRFLKLNYRNVRSITGQISYTPLRPCIRANTLNKQGSGICLVTTSSQFTTQADSSNALGYEFNQLEILTTLEGRDKYITSLKELEKCADHDEEAMYLLGSLYIEDSFTDTIRTDINKGIKLLERAAKLKHAKASTKLGRLFANGSLVPQDLEKAIRYLTVARKANFAPAVPILADIATKYDRRDQIDPFFDTDTIKPYNLYYQYIVHVQSGDEDEIAEGKEVLRKGAQLGCPACQHQIGLLFQSGHLKVKVNEQSAFESFLASAEQGYGPSLNALGICYMNGIFVAKKSSRAEEYFRKAIEDEIPEAYCNLGLMYAKGVVSSGEMNHALGYLYARKGVSKGAPPSILTQIGAICENWKKMDIALQCYDDAATRGDSSAMVSFAMLHEHMGTLEKEPKVMEYLIIASEANNPYADGFLARHFAKKKHYDPKRCIEYYKKGERNGLAGCAYSLAYIYDNGKFGTTDKAKALHYYQRAAELGDDESALTVAKIYLLDYEEYGLEQNKEEGLKCLQSCVDKGNPQAMYNLGEYFMAIAKDSKLAFEWFQKAADCGYGKAVAILAEMYIHGYGIKKDTGKGHDLYVDLMEQEHPAALSYFAEQYLAQNIKPKVAIKYLTTAAEAGDARGLFLLGQFIYEANMSLKMQSVVSSSYNKLLKKEIHMQEIF